MLCLRRTDICSCLPRKSHLTSPSSHLSSYSLALVLAATSRHSKVQCTPTHRLVSVGLNEIPAKTMPQPHGCTVIRTSSWVWLLVSTQLGDRLAIRGLQSGSDTGTLSHLCSTVPTNVLAVCLLPHVRLLCPESDHTQQSIHSDQAGRDGSRRHLGKLISIVGLTRFRIISGHGCGNF